MDQATRTDIAAAAAAHRELGSAYDDAVAESLIDRIGAEIDKRVEAKLGTRPESPRPPAEAAPQAGHGSALLTGAALGAGVTGLIALVADHANKHMLAPILLIWGIIAIIALATAAANRYRNAVRR